MGIKVIAIAPDDGWAFIIREDKVFLLRPPYGSSDHIEASEKDVENALRFHAFEECDFGFSNLKEAIEFLKDKYVEAMKNRGIDLPSSEELRELLKYATDDILLEYLEKAENELIPKRKLDAASSIALDIMRLGRENREINNMVISVLERCKSKRQGMKELATSIIEENQRRTWEEKFPNATDKISVEIMIDRRRSVCERGQLLAVGM